MGPTRTPPGGVPQREAFAVARHGPHPGRFRTDGTPELSDVVAAELAELFGLDHESVMSSGEYATPHDLLDAFQLRNRVLTGLGIREEMGGIAVAMARFDQLTPKATRFRRYGSPHGW